MKKSATSSATVKVNWDLPALDAAVQRVVSETLAQAIESDDMRFTLAVVDGALAGSADARAAYDAMDPLDLVLTLPLAAEDSGDDEPEYVFHLRDAISPSLRDVRKEGAFLKELGRFTAALRDLVVEIEGAMAEGRDRRPLP